MRGVALRGILLGLTLGASPVGSGAQEPGGGSVAPQRGQPLVPGDTVLATPDSRFEANAIHRWVLGSGWRELWALPAEAPVLDLDRFAGGLAPAGLGGGLQTRSLRFRGADGRRYSFRSLDKDATRVLDPLLRESLAADVLQDRISALFPLSAMVVAPLLDAAGVFHPAPELVVMPDDPRLGEHREDFAGLLGWIEERPDEGPDGEPGFRGSTLVVGSERLFERLEEGPDDRVDAEAFLRARLLDFLVGDWDRHPDQWRWAAFTGEDGTRTFQPVPRDRDWALSRLNGAVARLTGIPWPHYVGFGEDYPAAFRLSWSGRALDRPLLAELAWADWLRIVEDLQARVDHGTIDGAVARLPRAYRDRLGPWLAGALKRRRDDLPRLAREFYDLLAREVDVQGTDEDEVARVQRRPDGALQVSLYELRRGDPAPRPHYERTFLNSETREVRLDMRGGDDRVEVSGTGRDRIVLHIAGGGDDDTLEDRTDGRDVTFYGDGGDDHYRPAAHTRVVRRRWRDPVDPDENTHRAGYRSWGVRWLPLPDIGYSPDVGLLVGAGVSRTAYGYRAYPYRWRLRASGAFGSLPDRGRGHVEVDLPFRGGLRTILSGEASAVERDRFHGFGNGTTLDGPDARYHAPRTELRADARLRLPSEHGLEAEMGVAVEAYRAHPAPGSLVDSVAPYGWGDFDQLVVEGALRWKGLPEDPRQSGASLEMEVRYGPGVMDARGDFGSLRVGGVARLAGGGRLEPSVALRVGGQRAWGDIPLHEAAYLGGGETLRGFRTQRFAGDGSVFVGSEARLLLGDFVFLLPGRLGVLGLVDSGRVFGGDRRSDAWHTSVGGGFWFRWVDAYTLSVALARSREMTGAYVSLGFAF